MPLFYHYAQSRYIAYIFYEFAIIAHKPAAINKILPAKCHADVNIRKFLILS